jgi:septin family protein
MKQLQTRVNIIPVIGKADALTDEECDSMKAKVHFAVLLVILGDGGPPEA